MEFYTDFCREFEEVSICTLGPDFNHDGSVDEARSVKVIFSEWSPALGTAGGCRNDLGRFATNPQFLLTVFEADDHEDRREDSNHNLQDPKCEVIVSLAQEHRRSHRDKKVKLLQIGFCLYKAPAEGRRRLAEKDFTYQRDEGTSGPYINYREVFSRFELSPGAYVVIPATFEADAPSRQVETFPIKKYRNVLEQLTFPIFRFMIRVYSGKKISLSKL